MKVDEFKNLWSTFQCEEKNAGRIERMKMCVRDSSKSKR